MYGPVLPTIIQPAQQHRRHLRNETSELTIVVVVVVVVVVKRSPWRCLDLGARVQYLLADLISHAKVEHAACPPPLLLLLLLLGGRHAAIRSPRATPLSSTKASHNDWSVLACSGPMLRLDNVPPCCMSSLKSPNLREPASPSCATCIFPTFRHAFPQAALSFFVRLSGGHSLKFVAIFESSASKSWLATISQALHCRLLSLSAASDSSTPLVDASISSGSSIVQGPLSGWGWHARCDYRNREDRRGDLSVGVNCRGRSG
jgi:hypothetical protein